MSSFSRRQLLIFFGSSAAATALTPTIGQKFLGGAASDVAEAATLTFTPVRLPHPLPIYQVNKSYLATGLQAGNVLPPSPNPSLASFEALDDVIVPPEYERYIIVSWGDRVFSNKEEYVGYNCDYTGIVPTSSSGNENDVYLWINHEYNSFPISFLAPETAEDLAGFQESGPLVIPGFPTSKGLALSGEFMYNMGGSIVRISRKTRNARYVVVRDPKNRRLHGLSGLGVNSLRSDSYKTVTSWGTKSYQQGDQNYLIGTGPAATDVFEGVNADGLGNRIIGTAYNCSGGTTPWGTILTCEENFQAGGPFFVGVNEPVKPNGTQTGYAAGTTGAEFGLVGEKYGWVVEIAPGDLNFRPRKHSWLGRFRHENVAMRVEAGKKMIAYMGDDRRGGHTWKFVSAEAVSNPKDKSNSRLFERGLLYAAKFNADGTGRWIPLLLNTPTNPIRPTDLASVEIAALGTAQRNGLLPLPRRNGVAGQTTDGGSFGLTTVNQATALPAYQGKTLADFYTSQGALLVDAFLAANLMGATPTARPEDLEVHPRTKEVFIAYTDGAPGGDGYPDSRIFQVAKLSTAVDATQQSGGLYKIIEDSADGTGLTFRWQRLLQGGEAGSVSGAGFANVDNLAFDDRANVWGVTDMSTGLHNGFNTGAAGTPVTINHAQAGNVSTFVGVFGNNWLFYVPTSGSSAGEVIPFAYGPTRCEMTGPTFIGGDTLILAVQHPGEECPFTPNVKLTRTIEMLDLNGNLFNQTRTVARGSNWPSNIQGNPNGVPKPTVIGIRRKGGGIGRFV